MTFADLVGILVACAIGGIAGNTLYDMYLKKTEVKELKNEG